MRFAYIGAALAAVLAAPAFAQCPALPNQIANGQTADATKLMADLNQLRDCQNGVTGSVSVPNITLTNGIGGSTTIKSPAATAPYDFNLPADPGTIGEILVSNGPGNPTSWTSLPATVKPPLTDGYPVSRPTASSFSWVNQGTAALADHPNGPLTMMVPGNNGTDQSRAIYKATPTAAPFTVTAKLDCMMNNNGGSFCGIMIMNAAFKFTSFGVSSYGGNAFSIDRSSYFTSGPSNVTTIYTSAVKWVRIYDDGTLLYYSVSSNGADWVQIYSETLTTANMGTITQAGVIGEDFGSRNMAIAIHSFEVISGTGTNSSWQ